MPLFSYLELRVCRASIHEESLDMLNGLRSTPLKKYWIFALILTVFNTRLLKPAQTDSNSLLTESPVYSLDSSEDQTAASHLNPAGCFPTDPALSDGMRGWTSELRPENHS